MIIINNNITKRRKRRLSNHQIISNLNREMLQIAQKGVIV